MEENKLRAKLDRAIAAALTSEIDSLTKTSFLGSITHELREQMNGVMGMLDLLIESELKGEQREYANSAHSSAKNLFSIVEKISLFAGTETHITKLDEHSFNLFKAGNTVMKFIAGKAGLKNIALEYDYTHNTPHIVTGDAVKLMQVLGNILDNAVTFTEQGTVKMTVSVNDDNIFAFSIKDSGPGISEEKAALFFDFTEEITTLTPDEAKQTLELAVCKHIIEAMGGSIALDGNKGSGACFTIAVPLATPQEESQQVPYNDTKTSSFSKPASLRKKLDSDSKNYRNLNILVAEDDMINQDLARAFISRLEGSVDIASNGEEAVRMFQTGKYDAVFMDCEMPVMDGFDATRQIRSIEENMGKYTPVIAMTAYALQGDKERCSAAGMDDHIPKPITLNALEDVLNKHILPNNCK